MTPINCPKGYGLCWGCEYPCNDQRQFAVHLKNMERDRLAREAMDAFDGEASDIHSSEVK